ncbi:hypothetical protein [Scytonema sp. PCC 10023]|uniref:hypothetical protein n=1 Tax=Scytonema sp. PCC 10023 TaxID=1680591 RepID=UPI0039C64656
METRNVTTDHQKLKAINFTVNQETPQEERSERGNTIHVNDEIVAIVPVSTTVPNQPTNNRSQGYQWREAKMNTWRYLMVAGMVAGLALHGLMRFEGSYNIGSLVFGDKAVAATPTNVSNLREVARVSIPPANLSSNDSNLNHSTKQAKTLKEQPFAVKYVNGIPVPDWSKMNFENMKLKEAGSVEFPNVKNPGMKEKRVWSAGQSLALVMELGDFEATEFKIENLNLQQISLVTGISLKDFKLSDFETLKWQTLGDLAEAIPGLENKDIADIPALDDYVAKVTGDSYTSQTVGEALNNYPQLEKAELGKYIKLDQYKLTSIPGIEKAILKEFTNWQNTTIAKVPGLGKVPFDEFPGVPVPDISFVGKVDMVLKEVENGRWKSISGSYQEGFNVPCYNFECAHIEVAVTFGPEKTGQPWSNCPIDQPSLPGHFLTGQFDHPQRSILESQRVGEGCPVFSRISPAVSDILTGATWMSGKFQKVKGGFGILGKLNGGKEPTGRHPFGKSFKHVLWDVKESTSTVTSAMFFRICKRGWIDLGCSPYFIGPVPFFEYKEMDPIILGAPLTVPKKP